MNVGEWVESARGRLREAGIESPALEAQLLASHALLVERSWILAHPEEPFPDLAGESILHRRLTHEPLAYILGKREFYGRTFTVDRSVLIPRHETETLVETALSLNATRILDLGTGSGCIAITLKLENAALELTASDVSENALAIASRNAWDLGADVDLIASDGFDALAGRAFDLIVSNPPYIGSSEVLPIEVDQFEPHSALYSGPTGLEFFQMIAGQARRFLVSQGLVAMEVGYQQSKQVTGVFQDYGWTHISTRSDLSGIERVLVFAGSA